MLMLYTCPRYHAGFLYCVLPFVSHLYLITQGRNGIQMQHIYLLRSAFCFLCKMFLFIRIVLINSFSCIQHHKTRHHPVARTAPNTKWGNEVLRQSFQYSSSNKQFVQTSLRALHRMRRVWLNEHGTNNLLLTTHPFTEGKKALVNFV